MIELETQALVIGSGFGGAVAASRLVERGYQVTMLERGPWRNTLPVASMNVRQTSELPIKSWWQLIRNGLSSVNDWRFTGKRGIGLNGLLEKLPGACAQQFSQRIGTPCSTFQFNNVILAHSGVSLLVNVLFGDNKSTRYAAYFKLLKHHI